MSPREVWLPEGTAAEDVKLLEAACRDNSVPRKPLRELLARAPQLIERLGTLADNAEQAILEAGYSQAIVQEAARTELAALRVSLEEPCDGELERLLVSRAALCWLALSTAEMARAARWSDRDATDTGGYWDAHVSRINADFLRACKTLATVRRLRLPSIQVNVAQQQVNVAN